MTGSAEPTASTEPTGRPRIFLVEDHAMFRAGVRAELGSDVEVVGEADEVAAAIEMINERTPEVVLLDVHLPGGGGQAVLLGVLPHHPDVRFLALSVSDSPEDVIAVIRAGARGYITKTVSGGELLPGWLGSSSMRSPKGPLQARSPPVSTPSSTRSRHVSVRCCGSSPAGTPTRRLPGI
jgi:CheY-like chemotaxis protein